MGVEDVAARDSEADVSGDFSPSTRNPTTCTAGVRPEVSTSLFVLCGIVLSLLSTSRRCGLRAVKTAVWMPHKRASCHTVYTRRKLKRTKNIFFSRQ